tara:strand:+ start:67 stop:510 length:444 start_codon:yes stop_codon:yes gene_type:complete
MKKYYKCVYELKNNIPDKRYLFNKVFHKGTFRGFFESYNDCLEYAKKIENCKKVISAFSNNDVSNLAAYLKNRLTIKGYKVRRCYVTRYKSDCENRSKAGVDMISIEIDKPEKAYKEKFVNKFNIRDLNFANKNITYAQIFFDKCIF